MKIKITKPIKITEVGSTVLPKDHECEVSKGAGEIYVSKGYAKEESDKLSAADIIAIANEATDVKELEQYESDTRATVKKAIQEAKERLAPKE